MTTEEKTKVLADICEKSDGCESCPLVGCPSCIFETLAPNEIDVAYNMAFPETDAPRILDSGERREFDTGAVRDIQEGKGRCDLMPLNVICNIYYEKSPYQGRGLVLGHIQNFMNTGDIDHLMDAIESFLLNDSPYDCNWATMFLEVAKHFEAGAKKYGEYNWQKGIPAHCYIDSAVRHYLKWLRGDKDEPHDRAFVWNILCCIWTCHHKPELNDYPLEKNKNIQKE